MSRVSRIVITMGDPLGIGPEVIVKALSKTSGHFTVIGAWRFFKDLPHAEKIFKNKNVGFIDLSCTPGKVTKKQAGSLAFAALNKAVALIKSGGANALVTAPICKENIQLAGFKFPGHTEYLCHEFKVKKLAMMLFHEKLRVVLTTIHLPLKNIFPEITRKNIVEKLELAAQALKNNFKIKTPRIAVCGLNPHAGENGRIGNEEKNLILPAIRRFERTSAAKGVKIFGPVSADTVFVDALRGKYDAVLCHYHDQGLIAVKTTDFDGGVNLTLGLPFPRTSPDHGTAFDIAGKGVANPQSMIAAIEAAQKFI